MLVMPGPDRKRRTARAQARAMGVGRTLQASLDRQGYRPLGLEAEAEIADGLGGRPG